MLLAEFPIAVLMERRRAQHPWDTGRWSAVAVLPPGLSASALPEAGQDAQARYVVDGLRLELHRDEMAGYFENWVAPQPKVFVAWRVRDGRAVPVAVSVSYAEGTRMLDSGDGADGVPMPHAVHQWLGACLRAHHRPQPRGRAHE